MTEWITLHLHRIFFLTSSSQHIGVASGRVHHASDGLDSTAHTLPGVSHHGGSDPVRVVVALDGIPVDPELEDLSGLGTAVRVFVVCGDADALHDSLHGSHLRVHGVNTRGVDVNLPDLEMEVS